MRWDGDDLKLQILRIQGLNEVAAQTGAGLRIFIADPKPLASIHERRPYLPSRQYLSFSEDDCT